MRSSREELLTAFKDWAPRLLRLLERAEVIYKYGLFDRDPMTKWTAGRVSLLGDAAHPMLPFLSQGAAMALEDAYVFARSLDENHSDTDAALSSYEARRIARTTQVLIGSRKRGKTNHLTSKYGRFRRDVGQFFRGLWNPNKAGLQAHWIYEHDVTK